MDTHKAWLKLTKAEKVAIYNIFFTDQITVDNTTENLDCKGWWDDWIGQSLYYGGTERPEGKLSDETKAAHDWVEKMEALEAADQ